MNYQNFWRTFHLWEKEWFSSMTKLLDISLVRSGNVLKQNFHCIGLVAEVPLVFLVGHQTSQQWPSLYENLSKNVSKNEAFKVKVSSPEELIHRIRNTAANSTKIKQSIRRATNNRRQWSEKKCGTHSLRICLKLLTLWKI